MRDNTLSAHSLGLNYDVSTLDSRAGEGVTKLIDTEKKKRKTKKKEESMKSKKESGTRILKPRYST